jgi:acid phosphatase type 7
MSTFAGATWTAATPGATSNATTGLATAPAPGAEHTFLWNSRVDAPALASVLVRVRLGGQGLTAGPIVVDNAPLSTSVRLNRRPYLQLTQQTSTRICWRTEDDTDSVIEWGETAALGQVAGNPGAREKSHVVDLVGLRAGASYFYRVSSAGQPVTARETFSAAPPSTDGDFTFLAFGDSGTLSQGQLDVAARMATERPDFVIHTGDVIYPYGALGNAVGEYNDRFFEPYESFLGRTTIFPVIGNHDLIALLGQPFKEAFHLPDNGSAIGRELYFSFEYGDAKFIALETTALFLVPLGEHARWLQQEIAGNQRKWLIVYMHVPLYSCGSHGDNRILQQVLEPQFENGKVDLVIAGHDHDYERTKPIKQFNQDPTYPGLVHILTGGGGASTRGMSPNSRTEVGVSAHHYMRFTAHGDTLSGEAIDANGQSIDSFTIQNIR